MNTAVILGVFKLLAVGMVCLAIGITGFALAHDDKSLPHRYYRTYVAYLERMMRSMFIALKGHYIAVGQLCALLFMTIAGLLLNVPFWYLVLPFAIWGPSWYLLTLRRERIRLIETRLDGFILTLANALKTTPSIGNALAYAQPLAPTPMNEELALALKEMRVGNTVDQALLNMAARIGSAQLDATLAGMLIGRQVGGDLPKILETIATTLREMARLQGVLRAKTADSRSQIAVLTFMPVLLIFGFDTVKPGYFKPLVESLTGWMVCGIAGLLWGASILIAHRFLKVEI
jgi:tight adherence protein B